MLGFCYFLLFFSPLNSSIAASEPFFPNFAQIWTRWFRWSSHWRIVIALFWVEVGFVLHWENPTDKVLHNWGHDLPFLFKVHFTNSAHVFPTMCLCVWIWISFFFPFWVLIFVRDRAKPTWMGGVVLLPLKMEVQLVIFFPLD